MTKRGFLPWVMLLLAPLLALSGCTRDAPSASDASLETPGAGASGSLSAQQQEWLLRKNCDGVLPTNIKQVPDVDISGYSWALPSGFVTAYGYAPKIPYEGSYTGDTAVPSGHDGELNLIGFTLYPQLELGPLVDECGRITVDDMLRRVEKYRQMDSNTAPVTTEVSEVGGLPAVLVHGYDTDLGVTYSDYFLFGRNQMLTVTCQWQQQSMEQVVDAACSELLGSISFG